MVVTGPQPPVPKVPRSAPLSICTRLASGGRDPLCGALGSNSYLPFFAPALCVLGFLSWVPDGLQPFLVDFWGSLLHPGYVAVVKCPGVVNALSQGLAYLGISSGNF